MQIHSSLREISNVVGHYFRQIREGELRLVAPSLAFASILGLVPFLAVSLATFDWIGGPEKLIPKIENLLLLHFKVAAGSETIVILKTAIRNIQAQTLGPAGAVLLFLSAMGLLSFMEDGIQRIWKTNNRRSPLKRILSYALLIILWPLILATYLVFTQIDEFSTIRNLFPTELASPVLLILGLFSIYKLVPKARVQNSMALIAAALAAGGLILVQDSFRFFAKKVFQYNKIYGAFAAIPLFLVWLLIVWYIILGGVAICAALHRYTDEKKMKNQNH